MISSCPECGAAGVPLIFGLPAGEAQAAARHGELALGGCTTPLDPPNRQCPQGHRWIDPDEIAWDEQLLAVLVAHGYPED
jgi:hypothetical protein